jgi:hypothetical protein
MNIWQKLYSFREVDRQWAITTMWILIAMIAFYYWNYPSQIFDLSDWRFNGILFLAIVTLAGLIYRREWSRYTGLLLAAVLAIAVIPIALRRGNVVLDTLALIGVVYLFHGMVTVPITPQQERRRQAREEGRRVEASLEQVVLLLQEPIPEPTLQRLLHRHQLAISDIPADSTPEAGGDQESTDPNGGRVTGDAPVLFCFGRHCTMLLYRNYTPYPGAVLQDSRGGLQPAFGHRASIRLQYLPSGAEALPEATIDGEVAELALSLMDGRCAGLYFPEPGLLAPTSPQVVKTLRSAKPARVLKLATPVPSIPVLGLTDNGPAHE